MEVVIIADLPIATSHQLSTTELAVLLQQITPAAIVDYVDAQDVAITPLAGGDVDA
jgi:hypothetical protein